MNRINILQLVKKVSCGARLAFRHFIVLIFFLALSSCNPSNKKITPTQKYNLIQEERIWLREFFHDVLFEDPGAYVLYGTKPISWSCLRKAPTEEEKAQVMLFYESLSDEEKTKYIVREKDRFDIYANFQKWQKIKDRFPITQYLFGTLPARFGPNEGPDSLFLVNIEMTTRTLLNNYEDFRRALGYDFDPLQVVFEIENKDSKFWNEVMHNDLLIGIILGFGRDNAYFYEWHRQFSQNPSKKGKFLRALPCRVYNDEEINCPDSQHFELPTFGSYGLYPTDKKLIQDYREQQKFIKKLYRDNDEVDIALEWLTR